MSPSLYWPDKYVENTKKVNEVLKVIQARTTGVYRLLLR